MKRFLSLVLASCLVMFLSGAALADFTVTQFEVKNDSLEIFVVEFHEATSTDYDTEMVDEGHQRVFRDEATAWFLTDTEYKYTVKLFVLKRKDPICSYEATIVNRWNWTDWDFGPRVRSSELKSLADNTSCTASKISSTEDRSYYRIVFNGR